MSTNTTTHVQPSGFGPGDPEWDTISTFTGKPLTQKAREANDFRRMKNQRMLAEMFGGLRTFRVNRMVPTGGTQRNPKTGPRTFLVRATGGAEAKGYVQQQVNGMLDALPSGG